VSGADHRRRGPRAQPSAAHFGRSGLPALPPSCVRWMPTVRRRTRSRGSAFPSSARKTGPAARSFG